MHADTPPVATAPPSTISRALGIAPILFVVAFGFLLASFPARAPDLWTDLTQGRDLLRGQWTQAGTDRPTVVYDLMIFGLFSTLGPTSVAVGKALLVAAIGGAILQLARQRSDGRIAVLATSLFLLTAAPRLTVQPLTVSFALLTATAFLGLAPPRRTSIFVPIVFAVWVNVDRWALLGLGTFIAIRTGQVVDAAAPDRGRLIRRTLLETTLAAGACLLQPTTYHIFEGFWRSAHWGPRSASSPFEHTYFEMNRTPAGLAYYGLAALSALSFLLPLPRWNWARFLPWLGLTVLSAVSTRMIPFFAVVAAPIFAWNLGDFFARRASASNVVRPSRWARVALGAGGAVIGLALLAAAWPGWLQQRPPFEPRRWAIEMPASLSDAAAAIDDWRAKGLLAPDDRGLFLSAEAAAAYRWLRPNEAVVVDEEWVRNILGSRSASAPADRPQAGVRFVVLYDTDRTRLAAVAGRLFEMPEEWPLVYLRGDVAIVGWRDPRAEGAAKTWAIDLDHRALHSPRAEWAPTNGPALDATVRRWWHAFMRPIPASSPEREEARLLLLYAEGQRRYSPRRNLDAWNATATVVALGNLGTPNVWALGSGGALWLTMVEHPLDERGVPVGPGAATALRLIQAFVVAREGGPVVPAYLAVRAARRAIAANPFDAASYSRLAGAYLLLIQTGSETGGGSELADLRQAQVATALHKASQLDPTLPEPHLRLGLLFEQMQFLDLSVRHYRTYLRLIRTEAAGVPTSAVEQAVANLSDRVDAAERAYARESADLRVAGRAELASRLGLRGKALDILLESDISAFGDDGLVLELELLLKSGRAREVYDWLTPELERILRPGNYHWYRAQAAAALGDYAGATAELREIAAAGSPEVGPRQRIALNVARNTIGDPPSTAGLAWVFARALPLRDFRPLLADLQGQMQQAAEVTVIRGLLALEMGDADEAEAAFRAARAIWQSRAAAATGGGIDFRMRPTADAMVRWMQEADSGR